MAKLKFEHSLILPIESIGSFLSLYLSIEDEIALIKPEGTAEKIVKQLHKRTGYTFPASDELKRLFS